MNYITPYNNRQPAKDWHFNRDVGLFDPLFPAIFGRDHWTDAFGLKYDEKSQTYSTEVDVAGYKKGEVSIEVEDVYITVLAENDKRGSSSRSFYLSDVDPDTTSAKLEDGVLTVSVKKFPAKQPKRIEIQ